LIRSLLSAWRGGEDSGPAAAVGPGAGRQGAGFDQAVRQLRSASLDARLTAVYSLGGLAGESPDHARRVAAALTAHVRETVTRKSGPWAPRPSGSRPLAVHLQALLTVLGRLGPVPGAGQAGLIDLTGVDIAGANLAGAHLEGAFLVGADLAKANLSRAFLRRASLVGARLDGADLSLARLEGANLSGARLEGASLAGAHLEDAILTEAWIERADLRWAHLEGADLGSARGLRAEDIESAFVDQRTKLPSGLRPPIPVVQATALRRP
jgi:hypothetical protein